jgi:hypothetical protein
LLLFIAKIFLMDFKANQRQKNLTFNITRHLFV